MMGRLSAFKRIVIKIGSSLVIDRTKGLVHHTWLDALLEDVASLHRLGTEIILVSSGAIALGRHALVEDDRILRLEESQAAAAIGQIALSRAYAEGFQQYNISTAQILLTLGDTEQRRRYLNARSTLNTLLSAKIIPVVNENDTVATSEIRYGDNDRLAARVAVMSSADCVVLLSDVDGLYTKSPENCDAEFIADVPQITQEIESYAGDAASIHSRGGMRTKIDAAKIAVNAGTKMIIASGMKQHPLTAINEGGKATWFHAGASPITARKKWIAGHLDTLGTIQIDAGAHRALHKGKSLLPAGIIAIDGSFSRGDAVCILDSDNQEIARGLSAYDSDDARKIIGKSSKQIKSILDYEGRSELVHRDDLVLLDDISS